jgi:uroporphyrin-III C-methyltransferase/precorrin-2 dehydrogenase/sirohydrochlorin ferrochelatase
VSARGGFVSLVGAGPGDPELLTVRAQRRLAEAEIVFYDALVDEALLALSPRAQRFCVGKRAGRDGVRQEAIHSLLVRAARRGRRVVRLKCGDPFVFGCGGEEALALAAAGVAFEVVPGLSSALAAPALAGIPVTHRGLASAFVVVSGHDETAYRPILESLPPAGATVVVLMGLRRARAIAGLLRSRGWGAATPAAVVFAAGGPRQESWRGTLEELRDRDPEPESAGRPGTIVVGDVVGVAAALAGALPPGVAAEAAAR